MLRVYAAEGAWRELNAGALIITYSIFGGSFL